MQDSQSLKGWLKHLFAVGVLWIVYGVTLLVVAIFPRRESKAKNGRILVLGTFHNPNWFLAHIRPLSQCGATEILLVADGFVQELPNVTVFTPDEKLQRFLGRTGAKVVMALSLARRYRPDLYMGYAMIPAAISALVYSRLFGGSSCFQLTSGKLELEGGGMAAENRILSMLQKASPGIERLAFAITRRFDLLVVRGSRALEYCRGFGFRNASATITGSVFVPSEVGGSTGREYDIVFVGRLNERKRPDVVVEVVERLKPEFPNLRVAVVGDGPDKADLERSAADKGLDSNIEFTGVQKDVHAFLLKSKIFFLPSRWEGLSIAMLEAMCSGCVPVVNDVGDLADVVENGKTGFLIREACTDDQVNALRRLLDDPDKWARMSANARTVASGYSGLPVIVRKWHQALSPFVAMKSEGER